MQRPILFLDLNGTSVDDWEPSYAAMLAIFEQFERHPPSLEEYIRQVSGGNYFNFYIRNGICTTRKVLNSIFIPAYFKHTSEVEVASDLHDVLNQLKASDIEIHLLTAAPREFADVLLDAANMREYCDAFHFHVHEKKDQIDAVLSGTDIDKTRCAMIGDLPSDVKHAYKAGIHGIAYLNRHVPRDLFAGLHEMSYATDSFLGLRDFMLQLQ